MGTRSVTKAVLFHKLKAAAALIQFFHLTSICARIHMLYCPDPLQLVLIVYIIFVWIYIFAEIEVKLMGFIVTCTLPATYIYRIKNHAECA